MEGPHSLSQALRAGICVTSHVLQLQERAVKSFVVCTFLKLLISLAKDLLEFGPIFSLPGMCEKN